MTMLMTMLKVVKNGLSLSGICDKILCFRDLCFCVFFSIFGWVVMVIGYWIFLGSGGDGGGSGVLRRIRRTWNGLSAGD